MLTLFPEQVLYTGSNGLCAHEFILDLRDFKASAGVTEADVAKRLADYNFHAPTMSRPEHTHSTFQGPSRPRAHAVHADRSWPVAGTIMVEPTESEDKDELDRFCDALIAIRAEIAEIEGGKMPKDDNVLINAPHTVAAVTAEEWPHPCAPLARFPSPSSAFSRLLFRLLSPVLSPSRT